MVKIIILEKTLLKIRRIWTKYYIPPTEILIKFGPIEALKQSIEAEQKMAIFPDRSQISHKKEVAKLSFLCFKWWKKKFISL